LSAIRRELAVGEYTKAHQGLTVLAPHYEQLSPAQRREVKDDLCLTEYLIGEGSYPLSQQQRSCSEALAEPESASGAILARVHDAMKQSASAEVRGALDGQDLAAAEAAALAYRASPGADSQLLAGWSQDFWQVVHRRERSSEEEQRLASVIERLTKQYPQAKTLSDTDFARWVMATAAFPDKSIVAGLTIKGDTLDLLVRERDLAAVATNLYSFVRINDVFAARCGCNARTNIGITDLGFPAYLFRLDSEQRTSKILIALGNPSFGLTLPASTAFRETVEGKASAANALVPIETGEAQTDVKPSPGLSFEGRRSAGASGIGGSSLPGSVPRAAGSAPSPQSPVEQQSKPDSTQTESSPSSKPASAQVPPSTSGAVEPQPLGLQCHPAERCTASQLEQPVMYRLRNEDLHQDDRRIDPSLVPAQLWAF